MNSTKTNAMHPDATGPTAKIYRMVTNEHFCPFGLKAKQLLERKGFLVEDIQLTSREAVDEFKRTATVDTTPQIYIAGESVGGYEDLKTHLGIGVSDRSKTSYRPIIAIFSVAFLMSCGLSWLVSGQVFGENTLFWFIAISMCMLGVQKLQDIERFSTMFISYDLLAQKDIRYGYVYPFAETLTGILMLAGALPFVSGPIALFIGTVGAISVFKAVYIDKRDLKCACAGGDSRVPLGFVSLTENLLMMVMGTYTLSRLF